MIAYLLRVAAECGYSALCVVAMKLRLLSPETLERQLDALCVSMVGLVFAVKEFKYREGRHPVRRHAVHAEDAEAA